MFNFLYFNLPLKKGLVMILIIAMIFVSGGYVLLLPEKAHAAGLPTIDIGHIAMQVGKFMWEKIQWAWDKAKTAAMFVAENAQAVIAMENQAKTWADLAMQIIIESALRTIMAMLTNDIIAWVQSGYKGKPAFMSNNFQDYIEEAVNNAGGDFVTQFLGAGWLCNEFDLKLRIPLLAEAPAFQYKAKCTLEDIGANLTDFYNNFNNGGWKAWIQLAGPQNNFYGALLMVQSEKEEIKAKTTEELAQDAAMGGGYLSAKDCEWYDANGEQVWWMDSKSGEENVQQNVRGVPPTPDTCLDKNLAEERGFILPCRPKCEITTPGSSIANITNKSLTAGMDRINNTLANLAAKGGSFFKPYIMAIGDAMVNKLITDGLAKLKGSGPSTYSPPYGLPANPNASLPAGQTLPTPTTLPTDTNKELIPILTLKQNLEIANKSLKQLWINQQKAFRAIEKLKFSDQIADYFEQFIKTRPYEYKPVEIFAEFNYLHPILSGARNWYDICKPCQHGKACFNNFDKRKIALIDSFTKPFVTEDGTTEKYFDLEEYDKKISIIDSNYTEKKDNTGKKTNAVKSIVKKETADYTFSILDIMEGMFSTETTITEINTGREETRVVTEYDDERNPLVKVYTEWATSTVITYSPVTEYDWIDWSIEINNQQGDSIDIFKKSSSQEAINHIETIINDVIKEFEKGPDQTKEVTSKTEQTIAFLEDEYIPSAENYLKLYEDNIDNPNDPKIAAAETDMLAKKDASIEFTKQINYPTDTELESDNFKDLNEDIEEIVEKIVEEDGRLTQLLGDKDYPGKKDLNGLAKALDAIGAHLSELYFKCKTGITPLNSLVSPFSSMW